MRPLLLLALLLAPCVAWAQSLPQHLQDISVTVHAGNGSGSGVIVTREVKIKTAAPEMAKVNFVWTAAHVVDSLRAERDIIVAGSPKKVVEFKPMFVSKDLVENGRKVGEVKMEGRILKYSDAENGEDLALCVLYKRDFVKANTKFCLEDAPAEIGVKLFHVGSLLGQGGSNSMTTGILSQVGRVITLNNRPILFDQTTVTAFPGSSGGGVFIAEGDKAGQYCGMLVRGAGETFNLIVPARRLKEFATKHDLLWAIDEKAAMPSLEDLEKITVEGAK